MSTVCIVDDDPIYVFTASSTLKSKGICQQILVYTNGKEAYEGLASRISSGESLPDIILLDINMPVWDGWDFLKEFSTLEGARDIPVFIVSSSDHPDDMDRASKIDAVRGVILKPLTADKMKEVFDKADLENSN